MAEPTPQATLTALQASLADLETALAPLLATPLTQLLDGADPVRRAKLQVLVSYVVHDLIWISLKTSGVNADTHPVMQEIERLKTYFDKIKLAEGGPAPSAARPKLDTAAAGRFINAAIGSRKARVDPDYTPDDGDERDEEVAEPDESREVLPQGTHTRFDDAADKLLESSEESSEEEEEKDKPPIKAKEVPVALTTKSGKSSRPIMDPFAGYDSPKPKHKPRPKDKPESKRDRDDAPASSSVSKRQLKKLKLKSPAR